MRFVALAPSLTKPLRISPISSWFTLMQKDTLELGRVFCS
jgi:hypothetical protein